MLANWMLTQFQCRWEHVNFVRFSGLDQPIGETGKNLPVFNAFSRGSGCLKHRQSGVGGLMLRNAKIGKFLDFQLMA